MKRNIAIAGGIMIGTGLLLVIVGIVLGSIGMDMDYEQVADGSDFNRSYVDDSYGYSMDIGTVTGVKITIHSRQAAQVQVRLTIIERGVSQVYSRTEYTPIEEKMDVEAIEGYYDFKIELMNDTMDITDLDVALFQEGISDSSIGICCSGMILPIIGVILLIIGIILLIVGLVKSDRPPYSKFGAQNNQFDYRSTYGTSSDYQRVYGTPQPQYPQTPPPPPPSPQAQYQYPFYGQTSTAPTQTYGQISPGSSYGYGQPPQTAPQYGQGRADEGPIRIARPPPFEERHPQGDRRTVEADEMEL